MNRTNAFEQDVTDEIDPLHLYIHLVQQFGEGQAFLLDAAKETVHAYRMSLVGAVPILEVQVKDEQVTVFTINGLAGYLRAQLAKSGFKEAVAPPPTYAVSVVSGETLHFVTADPMALLESLRLAIMACNPGGVDGPFTAGLFGYIGYDAVHYLEELPKTTLDDRGLPDIRLQWCAAMVHVLDGEATLYDSLGFLTNMVEEDSLRGIAKGVRQVREIVQAYTEHPIRPCVPESLQSTAPTVLEDVEREAFIQRVDRAKEYIVAGDIFQVVLSKRMKVNKTVHHLQVYEALRNRNPSPYMFMAEYPDMRLFGASPEVQFRAVNQVAEMKPIAGTSKGRGKTAAEDEALVQGLVNDEKERAEHVMLVDLCRNDLGRVCEFGSVHAEEFMQVERYSHLFHLVSKVKGKLRSDVSVFHALLATFPAGTLSGAPKIRAMEIIDELEHLRRGPYGGMVGVIDFAGNANTAIVIRTIVEHNNTYYVQVGAGIVADSNAEQEWLECGHKAGALMDVLLGSQTQRS